MSKVILDLCGGTGSWSRPYADKPHIYTVHNITWPHYDVRKVNFDLVDRRITFLAQTDVVKDITVKIGKIHGILAAPPCTEFSLAKKTLVRPKWLEALETVEACERIIRVVRAKGFLAWWAMENPKGFLRQFLGVPRYHYEHWQFGELCCKPTDLWGWFTFPKPTVTVRPEMQRDYPNTREGGKNFVGWSNPANPLNLDVTRADLRAMTPAGFALAFHRVNR